MDRYHIIKRMRKLLGKVSLYLQGSNIPEQEVKNIVTELESLLNIPLGRGNGASIPDDIHSRVNIFLEAFKHYLGIEISNDPDIMGIEDMKVFLSKELGIKPKTDSVFHFHRAASPLHTLFI